MHILRTARPIENSVSIWPCHGCGVVHLKVQDTVVDLNRDDFATFAETVVDLWLRDALVETVPGVLLPGIAS